MQFHCLRRHFHHYARRTKFTWKRASMAIVVTGRKGVPDRHKGHRIVNKVFMYDIRKIYRKSECTDIKWKFKFLISPVSYLRFNSLLDSYIDIFFWNLNICFSPQSASSLLLTVANLENFAKIHGQTRNSHQTPPTIDNILKIQNKVSPSYLINNVNRNPNNFLSPSHMKTTKELDQLSTASSTHFTVVNGFGRTNVNRKSSYICKRSQQVSILIITMSVLFLIGISTAVILLESEFALWQIITGSFTKI